MNSLVSIIVPAYNAEATLKESIETLINQTYSNIEIVIIDDGSHDRTYDIASELSEQDKRIKTLTIENGGVSNARNSGIAYCTGKYVAFMDSDDHMELTMIEKLVSLMDENVDIVCCGHKIVSEKNDVCFEQKPHQMCTNKAMAYLAVENLQSCNCMNVLWNKLFRSSIIKANHLTMDISISMGEDLLFILDYLVHMHGIIKVIPDAEYRYTLSSNGLQANFAKGMELRINQLNRVRQFYISQSYPMNGFFLEELRTIYILILENNGAIGKVKKILSTPVCKEVCSEKISCIGKYKMFLMLLKLNNASILIAVARIFRVIKKIEGRSYKW